MWRCRLLAAVLAGEVAGAAAQPCLAVRADQLARGADDGEPLRACMPSGVDACTPHVSFKALAYARMVRAGVLMPPPTARSPGGGARRHTAPSAIRAMGWGLDPATRAPINLHWLHVLHQKVAHHHFARTLGVRTARYFACAQESPAALLRQLRTPLPSSYVAKLAQGSYAREVFVVRDGRLADLRSQVTTFSRTPVSLKQVVHKLRLAAAARAVRGARKHTFLLESFQPSVSDPGRAVDFKLYAFGRNVPVAEYDNVMTNRPGFFALACDASVVGCPAVAAVGGAGAPTPVFYEVNTNLTLVGAAGGATGTCGAALPAEAPLGVTTMRKLARTVAGALGAFFRVDFYETHTGPVLSELTFIPGWYDGYVLRAPFRDQLSRYLGAQWRGVEGGGTPQRTPCWFPSGWDAMLDTCIGFGTYNLTALIDANCNLDEPGDAADARKWRAAAREIAQAYAEFERTTATRSSSNGVVG